MFCSRFLGRTWDFPCLSLLKHDSTIKSFSHTDKVVAGKMAPGATVSSINTRERRSWFRFVWWVTQPGTAWGPGGQVGMDQPGTLAAWTDRSLLGCLSRDTASICLFSTASRCCIQFWATQWEKTQINCSDFSRAPGSWSGAGAFVLWEDAGAGDVQPRKKMASRGLHRSPPHPIPRGMSIQETDSGILHWCMVGGRGNMWHKLQHEVFRLDLREGCSCESCQAVKQVAWTGCAVSILLYSQQSHWKAACGLFVFSPVKHCPWLHSLRNP